MKPKHYILILALMLMPALWCAAQTTVQFTYDAAGNRIERNIITLKSAKVKTDSSAISQSDKTGKGNEVFTDSIGDKTIRVYPNPTHGALLIEISGYENETRTALYVYNLAGKAVMSKTPLSSPVTIDLSDYPNGTYLLKIVLGDKVSNWKILKE